MLNGLQYNKAQSAEIEWNTFPQT